MTNAQKKSIGIIGSGIAGLATARLLGAAGFDCEIFEKSDRVGGVWTVGYHTYGLQTKKELYEFPDWPMPASYPALPTGAQLQAYMESYARHFDLLDRIRLRSKVEALVPKPDDDGWLVRYTNGDTGEQAERAFDFLVVATGLYSNPYMPVFPDRERFQGEIYHSSKYTSPEQVVDRKVVVVGYGKSALDIAVDASKHASEVTLLFREPHWPVPLDVLGLIDVRKVFFNRLAGGFLPLYQRPADWEQKLHERAPWLVHGFWRIVERLVRFQFELDECDAVPATPMEHDLFNGGILPTNDTYPLLRSGAVRPRRGAIERYTPTGVTLVDGEQIDADTVIFSTGWKCDYSMLPEGFASTVDHDGLYLYRHVLHPDWNNLAFIGWASTYSNSLTSHLTALWLSHVLRGKITPPTQDQMRSEIEEMKTWKRSFMPAIGSRGSMLQLHMWHFHDELMREMGIEPMRKPTILAEWLADYSPADYADVFRHAWRNR